ncbi:AlpA family transcriptional regulator [Sandarakinorhabdus limnophila]|uniref:helix-turn-helix transcriptional regulator n=1 Tax=Sandarakinorhabdus limnophila TaxID=210512 RepID=UPI0026EF663B|nr:AlpA family phage regulatory protein [Sandarakinorhabdus limnophila]
MPENYQLLRRPDVSNKLGISKTQIYRLIKRGAFPAPHKLSERVSVWNEADIDAWLTCKFGEQA